MTIDSKEMYRKLAAISLPIMLQSLVQSSLGFVDTLMIGRLGQAEIAAVGTANQIFNLIQIFLYGVGSGAAIFFSQFYGARKFQDMKKASSLAMVLALGCAAAGAFLALCFPSAIIRIFSRDEAVIAAGVRYMRIVAPSMAFSGISLVLSTGFRAEGNPKTPLHVTVISLVTNTCLNYLLIFGPGPLPALGVTGGAIATFFSRFLEVTVLAVLVSRRNTSFRIQGKEDFLWSKDFLKLFITTSIPVILNDGLWSLGSTIYKVGFSKLGTSALAITNISESIGNIFFIAALGVANGSTVIIGNILGDGDVGKGKRWGKHIALTGLALGFVMGVLEILTAPLFIKAFGIDEANYNTALKTMYALAVLQPWETFAVVMITGVLRSGGDTNFAFYAETGCVYLLGIPSVFAGVYLFHLSLPGLYLMKLAEMMSKSLLAYLRIRSGKWARVMSGKTSR